MIAFVYGTTAELIKIAPVYRRLAEQGSTPLLWSTGQQADELPTTTARLEMPEPDFVLANGVNGRSLARPSDVPTWLMSVGRNALAHRDQLRDSLWSDDRPPIVLVHGDTMTTVVGAVLGRWLGSTVGHIEAGLRTNTILEPFPEELDRRVAARLAHVHYTPGIDKFLNLRGVGGIKVDTVANTVLDAVLSAPVNTADEIGGTPIPERFGLVSLHRFELLRQPNRLRSVFEALVEYAETGLPLLVVTDAQVSAQIESLEMGGVFDGERVVRLGKLPYFDFVSILRRAEFVVTDSGGLQEECAYLNKPCLVHRNTTERTEGIGQNALMSMYDIDVVRRFLANPGDYRSDSPPEYVSPSDLIVEHLMSAGHAGGEPLADQSIGLSVVVPAFGQAELIRSTLQSAIRELDRLELDYELLVLTDGSDGTNYEIALVGSNKIHVLHYADNAGQARGFRFAFAQSRGEIVVYADPSVLMTAENVVRAVRRLTDTGADVVTGSKTHAGSAVEASRVRRFQTEAFSKLSSRIVGTSISDAQLGLKVFRREVLGVVLGATRSAGFGFDIELLAATSDAGFEIEECPVAIPGRMKAIVNPLWLVKAAIGSLRLVVLRPRLRRDARSLRQRHGV